MDIEAVETTDNDEQPNEAEQETASVMDAEGSQSGNLPSFFLLLFLNHTIITFQRDV